MSTDTPVVPAAQPTKENPMVSVRDLLTKMKGQLEMALPKHMRADRLIRIALTACQRTPALLEADRVSFLGAIVQCAQLGLEPNDGTGKAWLIPFNNKKKGRKEVQFIPGYKGLIQLARNSGEVSWIQAHAVYEKDHFKFEYGLEPILEHRPDAGKDRGKVTHFYAVAKFRDGTTQFVVMTVHEVEAIRSRSQAANAGPWVTDFDEMGKKTAIRRLSKVLPASAELHTAVALDEKAEKGIAQDLSILVDPNEKATPEDTDDGAEEADMPKRKSESVNGQAETPAAAAPPEPSAMPTPAANPDSQPKTESVIIALAAVKEPKGKQTDYEILDMEGVLYYTANKTLADKAIEILRQKSLAKLAWITKDGRRIIGVVEKAEAQAK